MDNRPIGVFDSGVGGLTVLKELMAQLPSERFVYLGDTARLPYGTKSATTIAGYAVEDARFLISQQVKLIVVACNSASAYGVEAARSKFEIPIMGVIEDTAAVVAKRGSIKVGLIGTEATLRSQAYQNAISKLAPEIEIQAQACSLLPALVEEGWIDDAITRAVAERYLCDMREGNIQALVLGCTHFPLMADIIAEVLGPNVELIDPAKIISQSVASFLEANDLRAESSELTNRFYLTDVNERFQKIAERFLPGQNIDCEYCVLI